MDQPITKNDLIAKLEVMRGDDIDFDDVDDINDIKDLTAFDKTDNSNSALADVLINVLEKSNLDKVSLDEDNPHNNAKKKMLKQCAGVMDVIFKQMNDTRDEVSDDEAEKTLDVVNTFSKYMKQKAGVQNVESQELEKVETSDPNKELKDSLLEFQKSFREFGIVHIQESIGTEEEKEEAIKKIKKQWEEQDINQQTLEKQLHEKIRKALKNRDSNFSAELTGDYEFCNKIIDSEYKKKLEELKTRDNKFKEILNKHEGLNKIMDKVD